MPLTPQQAQSLAEQLLDDEDPADASSGPAAPTSDAQNQGLPQYIGPYRIVGVIASGGMGVVYEAEQEHPRRVVALKVLKHGLTSPSALRRFEHEAQVLARLRHDGIAHIYDAGTHDDGSGAVPYFAMELIPNARSIVQFAEDHKLSLRARLELFATVCDAVHHGHQKGIIHRDLKPANILVEGADNLAPGEHTGGWTSAETEPANPRIKIIDFGIARATDADVALTTLQTDVRELIGTLQYMSPEQCAGDPHDLDIRSDIYSLGVVLYELLTGHLPYDLSHKSLPSATRMIQEQEPAPPSTMSKQFRGRGRGDLEAILLTALQKDREKRYQSAMDLCRDVRRYLRGEPIEARAPTRWSLAMRWVARHPLVTTTAACLTIAVLTLGATSLSVWFYNFRPHHMVRTPDGREARLMSIGGSTIHTWSSDGLGGITFAKLIPLGADGGGGQLVVIGQSALHGRDHRMSPCAYDTAGDLNDPVWRDYLKHDDVPDSLLDRGRDESLFGISFGRVEDIFSDNPGPEIIVAYQSYASQCAVRILSAERGKLLYQVWHDGNLQNAYWMEDAGLLLMSGLSSEVYGPQRGFTDAPESPNHPAIVLALQPRLGHIGMDFLTADATLDEDTLVWYRCLLPIHIAPRFYLSLIPQMDAGEEVGISARLRISAYGSSERAFTMLLDATGQEIAGKRRFGNAWAANPPIPDHRVLELGDLPPILSQSESANKPSGTGD